MSKVPVGNKQIPIEGQLARLTFFANVIPSLALLLCLWIFDASVYLLGIALILLLLLTAWSVTVVWRRTQFQYRNLLNLLDAIVGGDYSFRGRSEADGSTFGALVKTINALTATLQRQRLQSEESQLLVQKVVDQIDVAIIAWDQHSNIRLLNPAASQLLGIPVDETPDRFMQKLQLPDCLNFAGSLEVGKTQVQDLTFSGTTGRFRLYRERFISEGETHDLLFITNISNILRLEEKRAWRNLVRVLSHEINNSLVPMKSFSNTLIRQVERREQDAELKQEIIAGMTVIGDRADSIAEFVRSYHRIARLPEPQCIPCDLAESLHGICTLFAESQVELEGISLFVLMDPTQMEQVFINLIKNAMESSQLSQRKEPVRISWFRESFRVVIQIVDSGEGIENADNLFTPYYTTKPDGSGIGLVFCQEVIEAHGGSLTLRNRQDGRQGCVARVELPLE